MVEDFQLLHWALIDLLYEYLDDGFKLTALTDVPCHLYCRMTTTPPRKHATPIFERGVWIRDDIRFCFVVYEDNEQEEEGDTLIHTFLKPAWPVCETRYFYFWGTINSLPTKSDSAIFTFHFPAPPPKPPPPIFRPFFPFPNNRTIESNWGTWAATWAGMLLKIREEYDAPYYMLTSGASLTASYWIYRGFLTFDTSTLPLTAKIVSAYLGLFVTYRTRTASSAYPFWQVTKGHQSDPVVVADWYAQNAETQVLGQLDYAALLLNQYNHIPLNSDGLAHIKPGGLTKFCLRSQLDVENHTPYLGANTANFSSAQKGIDYLPNLWVVYYPA